WVVVLAYLAVPVLLVLWWLAGHAGLGMEIFPAVDAGQVQVRLRAPTGTRIQRTEEMTLQALDVIKDAVGGADNIDISVAFVGVPTPNYPINNVYLWTSGPEEAVLRVALKRGSGVRVEDLKQRLRPEIQARLQDWLRGRLTADGLPPDIVAERLKNIRLSFEPADIVNEVMSFGAPTPIEVAVSGPRLPENRAYAEKVR